MFDIDPTRSTYEYKSASLGTKARTGMAKYLDRLPEGELRADGMWHYGAEENRERTEWLEENGGDGLLIWDFDQDGQVDSSKELFGEFDVDGQKRFEDGYQKLAHHFDRSGDGRIEGAELDGLGVWKDGNADGVTQDGELISLEELGIDSFDVVGTDREDMSSSYTFS